jgi:hypothetical protein
LARTSIPFNFHVVLIKDRTTLIVNGLEEGGHAKSLSRKEV